ncbi:MAG: hypothetical protein KAI79_04295 [Bacteroidales bacterium]|nr:hypothetical protein [Bacteroidales bacterium]
MSGTTEKVSFNTDILNYTQKEFIMGLDAILNDNLPEGKTVDDFTGGYIQQLKNSNRLTCFFGTKEDGKNKSTVQIAIATEDLDLTYLMLKCKVQDLHNKTSKIKKVSMSSVMLDIVNKKPSSPFKKS